MADIRKPVKSAEGAEGKAVMTTVHEHLLAVTERGARDIGCSGVSFVIIGMSTWVTELYELEPKATSELLAALSVIFNPGTNARQKARAEKKRAKAVRTLMAAVDLEMTAAEGSG